MEYTLYKPPDGAPILYKGAEINTNLLFLLIELIPITKTPDEVPTQCEIKVRLCNTSLKFTQSKYNKFLRKATTNPVLILNDTMSSMHDPENHQLRSALGHIYANGLCI